MSESNKNSEASKSPKSSSSKTTTPAVIGSSIKIIGDVIGEEDLIIHGEIEGIINLRDNDLTIGEHGRVNANVNAKNITVEGEVIGELRGSEQILLKPSGRVTGDIKAPRVSLNDGCQFKGSVDMDAKSNNKHDNMGSSKLGKNIPFPSQSVSRSQSLKK